MKLVWPLRSAANSSPACIQFAVVWVSNVWFIKCLCVCVRVCVDQVELSVSCLCWIWNVVCCLLLEASQTAAHRKQQRKKQQQIIINFQWLQSVCVCVRVSETDTYIEIIGSRMNLCPKGHTDREGKDDR